MYEQIQSICDSCLLIEINKGGGTYLQHYEPKTYDFNDQLQYILVNAFPSNLSTKTIFAFTTQSKICYAYNFIFKTIQYSIVLVSSIKCPQIFLKFLKDIKKTVDEVNLREEGTNNEIDGEARFALIWSTIKTWHYISKNEAVVTFTGLPFQAILSVNYNQFSPFKYFSTDTNYLFVWRYVLTGRRILIVSKGALPKDMTNATFGIASLSGTFPYRGKILLCQNSQDPRLLDKELINEYNIICCPDMPSFYSTNDFDAVLTIQINKSQIEVYDKLIQARNQRLLDIVTFFREQKLTEDPYSDFLEEEIGKNYTEVITPKTMDTILNEEQFQDFLHTTTFKVWRRNTIFNNQFRDAFLSIIPEIALVKKNTEELNQCLLFLDMIKKNYTSDIHMISVAKRHKKIIKRLLKGEQIEAPKSAPCILSTFQLNFSSDEQ